MSESVVTRTFVIKDPQGLHARPAQIFAKTALQFKSHIELLYADRRIDAKSILEILTLGADGNAQIILEARGDDAEQAAEALVQLANDIFANDN